LSELTRSSFFFVDPACFVSSVRRKHQTVGPESPFNPRFRWPDYLARVNSSCVFFAERNFTSLVRLLSPNRELGGSPSLYRPSYLVEPSDAVENEFAMSSFEATQCLLLEAWIYFPPPRLCTFFLSPGFSTLLKHRLFENCLFHYFKTLPFRAHRPFRCAISIAGLIHPTFDCLHGVF